MHERENHSLQEQPLLISKGLGFYKLFWIFLIGCFVGVIVEMAWCLLIHHKLESRAGLLYGPFNPVYGFGAVFMTLLLTPVSKKRNRLVFLYSMVIGGLFEWLCSYVQETLVGTVSWEYSHLPLNLLGGRTNLLYCLFWGFLGLFWIKYLYPRLSKKIEQIPIRPGRIITWALVFFMVCNMAISALAVARETARHQGVPAANQVDLFLDRHYPTERIKKVYPNMIYAEDKNQGTYTPLSQQ